MKLHCVLISLAFVNVSSDYTETDYIKDVFITNAHIELAYNMNNFAIKDTIILNGLEHVIQKIIESRNYLHEFRNAMLVVPEYKPRWYDWNVLRLFQNALADEIQSELNIPVPKIPDENFGSLNLNDLAVKRRVFTRVALRNILSRTINFGKPENVTNLINKRRDLGMDNFENRISLALAGPEKENSLTCMCRLIALFMSTITPESHIKHFNLNPDGSCTLKDDYEYEGSGYKTYRKIQGQWCQIFGDVVQPLKELL